MDIDYSTFCSNYSNHPHLPRRNNKIHYSKEAHSHLVPTTHLQCCITWFSFATTIWTSALSSEYFFGHGKPEHDQHIIIRFLYMATPRETPGWEPGLTLSYHVPTVPVDQLYRHMISGVQHITPFTFTSPEESTEDTVSIWTLFSHTGVYIMAIGLLTPDRIRGSFAVISFGTNLPD